MTVHPAKETAVSLLNGRQLNAADSDGLNKVVVLDETVAKQVFGSKEAALNNGLELKGQVLTVVGVSANTSGEIGPQNYEPLAYFPKKTYTHYLGKKDDHSVLALKFNTEVNQDTAMTKVLKQLNMNGESRRRGSRGSIKPMIRLLKSSSWDLC